MLIVHLESLLIVNLTAYSKQFVINNHTLNYLQVYNMLQSAQHFVVPREAGGEAQELFSKGSCNYCKGLLSAPSSEFNFFFYKMVMSLDRSWSTTVPYHCVLCSSRGPWSLCSGLVPYPVAWPFFPACFSSCFFLSLAAQGWITDNQWIVIQVFLFSSVSYINNFWA